MARNVTAVGLDIGRYAARAVWMTWQAGQPRVVRAEALPLPLDSTDPGPVLRPWIEQTGLAKRGCALGLPGGESMFQPIPIAPGDPRSDEQAARIEVVKYNEMVQDEMVYGCVPVQAGEGDRRLLLAMARPGVTGRVLETARGLGLNVIDIVPTPVALFNALCPVREADGLCLYLGIGAQATDLAVGLDDRLLFARSFAVGGRLFTDAVARERGVTAGRAQSEKEAEGDLRRQDDAVGARLRSVADLWLSELRSCLSVYRSLFPGAGFEPVRAVLAGGGARLAGLAGYASSQLGIPFELPATCAGEPGGVAPAEFAVACGLALAALGRGGVRMSLLPPEVREDLLFRRDKPYWVAAGAAAGLILAVSLVGGYRDYRRKHAELREREASLERRQRLVGEIEGIRAQGDLLESLASPVARMLRTAPSVRSVLSLLAEARNEDDRITMVCDAASYFAARREGGRRPARPGGRALWGGDEEGGAPPAAGPVLDRLMIQGYTRKPGLTTVKDLIARLKEAPFVASADLLSDDELVERDGTAAGPGGERVYRFVIDLTVNAS